MVCHPTDPKWGAYPDVPQQDTQESREIGDKVLEKSWGFFRDEGRLNFEFFGGFIPENPQNIFGEILGTGISLTLGIFEFFPRKNSNFGESPKIPILLMNT